MARAIWSGSISFGLVNIPVKLFNAVSRKSVSFNQIDSRTGARIRYQKVSGADGSEVPNDAIVKGYELPSGEYVLINDDELALLDPEAVRSIDIEEFVDLAEIDPIFYDSAYYLAPDKATVKPYALLAEAMERSQKVGIARFVMRSKQYLAAVRPKDGKLLLSTMVYADEVNDTKGISELEGVADVDVNDRELAMAQQLIESLSAEFAPEKFEDTYRNRVIDLIERKAAGETELVAAPQPVSADKVVDLMAALEASVAAAKETRKRHPTSRPADETPADGEAAAPTKKSAAKKAAPRKRKSA
ncbi:MAG: end-binding protein Ku [Acidimicrobiaceae bacterium]|jgi:DNA end-binding protein Ku